MLVRVLKKQQNMSSCPPLTKTVKSYLSGAEQTINRTIICIYFSTVPVIYQAKIVGEKSATILGSFSN